MASRDRSNSQRSQRSQRPKDKLAGFYDTAPEKEVPLPLQIRVQNWFVNNGTTRFAPYLKSLGSQADSCLTAFAGAKYFFFTLWLIANGVLFVMTFMQFYTRPGRQMSFHASQDCNETMSNVAFCQTLQMCEPSWASAYPQREEPQLAFASTACCFCSPFAGTSSQC
jgi:predicted PurR-regulated permease PerM